MVVNQGMSSSIKEKKEGFTLRQKTWSSGPGQSQLALPQL